MQARIVMTELPLQTSTSPSKRVLALIRHSCPSTLVCLLELSFARSLMAGDQARSESLALKPLSVLVSVMMHLPNNAAGLARHNSISAGDNAPPWHEKGLGADSKCAGSVRKCAGWMFKLLAQGSVSSWADMALLCAIFRSCISRCVAHGVILPVISILCVVCPSAAAADCTVLSCRHETQSNSFSGIPNDRAIHSLHGMMHQTFCGVIGDV